MELENPENSPAEVVSAIDQPPPQVATATRRRGPMLASFARLLLCCESGCVRHQLASVWR